MVADSTTSADSTSPVGWPTAKGLSANQAARRGRIVDAAAAMLDDDEHGRIQVRDIAERASVALATLYHYFPSKEHLFGEVLVQQAGLLRTNITRRPLEGSPTARLSEALRRTVRAFERRPQLAKLFADLEGSDDPFVAEVLRRVDTATNGVYVAALEGIDPARAARIVSVVDAVLDSALRSWSAGRLPIDDVYRRVDDAIELLLGPDGIMGGAQGAEHRG